MALLAWWSAPEAKLITNFEEKNEQSQFVYMLQTLPISSNSEVLILFTRGFDIHLLVRDEDSSYAIFFLL